MKYTCVCGLYCVCTYITLIPYSRKILFAPPLCHFPDEGLTTRIFVHKLCLLPTICACLQTHCKFMDYKAVHDTYMK